MRTRRAQARGSRKDGMRAVMRTRGQAGARFVLRRDAGCDANSGAGRRAVRVKAGCGLLCELVGTWADVPGIRNASAGWLRGASGFMSTACAQSRRPRALVKVRDSMRKGHLGEEP